MKEEKIKIDAVIIGGGIIGISCAYELIKQNPNLEIALFESHHYLGDQTTGRNSGVLHSGLYYPTDSLKHRLCLEGLEVWKRWALDLQIPYRICGKYVFAKDLSEVDSLEKLYQQGQKNQVQGLRRITQGEFKELQQVVYLKEAFFVQSSGILDVPMAVKRLAHILEVKGVATIKGQKIENLNFKQESNCFEMETSNHSVIEAPIVINCAGLGAIKLREKLELYDLKDYWVKGNYLKTSQKLNLNGLYYPIPKANLKGLGVHSTIDSAGQIRFGPNTQDVESVDYSMDESVIDEMNLAIASLFKGIERERLQLDYCGIRPKIKDTNGELYSDFWIASAQSRGLPGYFECCGIESPGLTAAPAIARKIAAMVLG